MSNITTLEQAKRLKKFGFNRQAFTYWELEHDKWVMTRTLNPDFEKGFIEYPEEGCIIIPAPTIPEALDWIREEKEIEYGVILICESFVKGNTDGSLSMSTKFVGYDYSFFDNSTDKGEIVNMTTFDAHPIAESALLDAVLNYLENKGGE